MSSPLPPAHPPEKLKAWIDDPPPYPPLKRKHIVFLYRFDSHELREGLIHGAEARQHLLRELDGLSNILCQYTRDPKSDKAQLLRAFRDVEFEAANLDVDRVKLMMPQIDDPNYVQAIRTWMPWEWRDEPHVYEYRMLRYSVAVVARMNEGLRKLVCELRRGLGRAQGDIE